jgi:hypothetical protein
VELPLSCLRLCVKKESYILEVGPYVDCLHEILVLKAEEAFVVAQVRS